MGALNDGQRRTYLARCYGGIRKNAAERPEPFRSACLHIDPGRRRVAVCVPPRARGSAHRRHDRSEELHHGFSQNMGARRDVLHSPVHKKPRTGANLTAHGALDVLAHALAVDFIIQGCLEQRQIQVKSGRVSVKCRAPKIRTLLQKNVVHLPKLALIGRRLRGFRRDERVRMCALDRMMPKYEPHIPGMAIEYLANGGLDTPTEGTFKVPIFDKGDTRMRIAAYVISWDHRIPQVVPRCMVHVGTSQLTITASGLRSRPFILARSGRSFPARAVRMHA
jgi:hypothetical protein